MTPGKFYFVDKEKKTPRQPDLVSAPETETPQDPVLEGLYAKLRSQMRRPKPGQDAMASALEVVQRLAGEVDTEDSAEDISQDLAGDTPGNLCRACGYRNRQGNRFCAMCGLPVDSEKIEGGAADSPRFAEDGMRSPESASAHPQGERVPSPAIHRSSATETHHYHHHYHHHYFQPGQENGVTRQGADVARDFEKLRSSANLRGESMSRAEAAVRRVTQEWVLACNTKHLDDLLDLYIADALVLRSNYPPVRGAAAIREFFFGALHSGLGEVEVDPIRVEVVGDMAYEAGRCKALVPGAAGKRREERGKYLWVFARQSNGEWKLASDCWSSDLTLPTVDADIAPIAPPKTAPARKNP
jgi:uncharacterized protein (TIGR02246 family)